MSKYHYLGYGAIGDYVNRALDTSAYARVDDIESADIVITYFTNSSALEDAYLDHEGIVKAANEGTLIVDLSACTPSLAHELAGITEVNNLRFVEAPIAFGPRALAGETLVRDDASLFVSGEPAYVSEIGDVAAHLAANVVQAGPSGSAQLLKASRSISTSAMLLAAAESAALVRQASEMLEYADPKALLESIASSGNGAIHAAMMGNEFKGELNIEMLMGDIVAALSTAEEASLTLPQLETALRVLELLAVIGGSDLAPAAATLVYSDEIRGEKSGLDWKRAEELYSDQHAHDHEHDHGGSWEEYGEFDGFGDAYDDFAGFDVEDEPEGSRWPL